MPRKYPPSPLFIFRIIHVDNLDFALANGLFAATHPSKNSAYRFIGDSILTQEREVYEIPELPHAGELGDYIPFYFGARSPMLLNIITGRRGIPKVEQPKIVYIVCKWQTLIQHNCQIIFTDGHAKSALTTFYEDPNDLSKIDFDAAYSKKWSKQADGGEAFRKKQAEVLVKHHVPVSCIDRLYVYNREAQINAQQKVENSSLQLKVAIAPETKLYF